MANPDVQASGGNGGWFSNLLAQHQQNKQQGNTILQKLGLTGSYQQIPGTGADSYQMVDPNGFSAGAYAQLLQGLQNLAPQQGGMGNINQYLNAATLQPNQISPNQLGPFSQFKIPTGDVPQVAGQGPISVPGGYNVPQWGSQIQASAPNLPSDFLTAPQVNVPNLNTQFLNQGFSPSAGGLPLEAANAANQAAQGFDPNASVNSLISQAPGLINIFTGPQSQLEQMDRDQLSRLTNEAVQNVAGQLSSVGGLHSGALGTLAGQAAGQVASDTASKLAANRLGVAQNLVGNALGELGANQRAGTGYGLQAAQLGSQTGLGLLGTEQDRYLQERGQQLQAAVQNGQLTAQQAQLQLQADLANQGNLLNQQLTGAQLGLQATGQNQQQQQAFQNLGLQAGLQNQQLGFQGNLQGAQMDQAANLANQNAMLQMLLGNQQAGLTSQGQQSNATLQALLANQNANQFGMSQNLGAAQLLAGLQGQQGSTYANVLGQLAGFGAPTYAQPQTTYQPGLIGNYFNFLGQVAPAVAAAAGGGA